MRNPHLDQTSKAENFWPWKCLKNTAACQGHAPLGHDRISYSNNAVKKCSETWRCLAVTWFPFGGCILFVVVVVVVVVAVVVVVVSC